MAATLSPSTGFDRALQRFKQFLPKDLADQFATDSLASLKKEIKSIQTEHGNQGKLRNMQRAGKFIEAMVQFGQVIEVFVNANDFVCFIWGPMKFLLGMAKTHIDTFDKLMDAYSQIADAIPGLLLYQATFEKHEVLRMVLVDYYSDVLRFHQEAMGVFKQSRWRDLFHATWKTFDTRFAPIIQSLKSRRDLLDSEKTSATLYEIQAIREKINDARKDQIRHVNETALEKHRSRIVRIREKLKAPDFTIDQEFASENRNSGGDTGKWIFEEPTYSLWSSNKSSAHCVLYINGIPGAGKTTLVSGIVERFLDDHSTPTAYFYFKHGDAEKNNHNCFLRAVLAQLLDHDTIVSQAFFDELSDQAEVNIRTTKNLQSLTKRVLEECQSPVLILDGLDECAQGEAQRTVEWLLYLFSEPFQSLKPAMRVLFAGQRDGVLDKLLNPYPSISLESSEHMQDVHTYCRQLCKRTREKFRAAPALEEEILSLVTTQAKGMFLYARVVLENLLHQTRLTRLKQEIQPGIFPHGIYFAYERVVARVIQDASPAEREDAMKVLGLVIAAKRDLRWREIQSFFCINPVNAEVDYENRLQLDCKQLCGSLVDTYSHGIKDTICQSELVVKIVHDTAKRFLIERKLVSESIENAKISLFCTTYLVSTPFKLTARPEQVDGFATRGYYSLQDYAVQYWYQHSKQSAEISATSLSSEIREAVISSGRFLQEYAELSGDFCNSDPSSIWSFLQTLHPDERDRASSLKLDFRTTYIRNAIESLRNLTKGEKEVLDDLYGPRTAFKCDKPWCARFSEGFSTYEERSQHMDRHERPFLCQFQSCFGFVIGFDSEPAQKSHHTEYHEHNTDSLQFPTNIKTETPTLLDAIENGALDAIRGLLDAGEPLDGVKNYHGYKTPVWFAASLGRYEICKLLTERGADIDRSFGFHRSRPSTPLAVAVAQGHTRLVEFLLNFEIVAETLTERNIVATLYQAIEYDIRDFVRSFLKHGYLLGIKNQEWVLIHACQKGSTEMLHILLDGGGLESAVSETCMSEVIRRQSLSSTERRHSIELLLSRSRLKFRGKLLVRDCINRKDESLTKLVLSYLGMLLNKIDLETLRREARLREFSDVVELIDGLLKALN